MANAGKTKVRLRSQWGSWKRMDADRVCQECTARHRDAGEPYQCNVCRFWFSEEAFPTNSKHRRNRSSFYRVCSACETQKPCHRCNVRKPVTEITASAWKARHANRRICKTCMKKGQWTCAICHLSLAHMEFSAWLRRRPSGQQDGTQECNRCVQSHAVRRAAARARKRLETRRRTARQRRERIRKGRAPAGFVPKPLRNRSRKNAETSLLEPTKNKRKTKKKQRNSDANKPLRNRSRKNAETSLLEPIKKKERPSRFCVQAIAELQPQKSRNVAFGTPKNNGIVPQPLRNFSHHAKRNFSHQAKPKKAASGAHPKKQSPSRFCAQTIAKPQPEKCRNVAFPLKTNKKQRKNKEIVP